MQFTRKSLSFFLLILIFSCNTKHRIWVGKNGEQKIFNLKYGEHQKQKMDVFLPRKYSPDSPIVLIIHGGSWKYGNKEHMIMIQNYLFKNNIPTININYQLVKKNITYKNQLDDIKLAIKKINSLAKNANIKEDNYILLGESSGGHLALLYGYAHPNSIKKIISLSSPTDFYTQRFKKQWYSIYVLPTVEKVVGKKYNRQNTPKEFIEASPIANVSNVPTLLFQGDLDFLVNKQQGMALDAVLTDKKIPHELILMKNTGHTPRFFNKKKRNTLILPKILEFIVRKEKN